MTHRHPMRRGIKLVELVVVVLIAGVAFGMVLRALTAAREAGRLTQCSNNMRQLGLALLNFSTSKNRFPNAGTYYDDPALHRGDPTRSAIYVSITDPCAYPASANPWLRSWVVDVMPYLDSPDMPDAWNKDRSYLDRTPKIGTSDSNFLLSSTHLRVLVCPDAAGQRPGGPLSYVVNGGFVRWPAAPIAWSGGRADGLSKNGEPLEWTQPGTPWQDTQAICKKMGVMFLGTHTGDQPWDITTAAADIVDGASTTLLLGENSLAGTTNGNRYSGGVVTNWACPLPNFCMFIGSDDICHTANSSTECLGGQLKPVRSSGGAESGPGWSLASHPRSFERLNHGQNLTVRGSFPFVTSGHPGGANFVFCDGSTRFIRETIDGRVYANLITPAGTALPESIRQTKIEPSIFDELD